METTLVIMAITIKSKIEIKDDSNTIIATKTTIITKSITIMTIHLNKRL